MGAVSHSRGFVEDGFDGVIEGGGYTEVMDWSPGTILSSRNCRRQKGLGCADFQSN